MAIINIKFSIPEICSIMDSVSCGTEETSGSDKFESRWKSMLNTGYQIATAEKYTLEPVFGRTMIWKGQSMLCKNVVDILGRT